MEQLKRDRPSEGLAAKVTIDNAQKAESNELSAQPENKLAEQAGSGCALAFSELYRRYHLRLSRFIAKRLPNQHDVEDVVQEAFSKAWLSIDRFDPQFRFSTWLYTIASRTSIDHGRRRTLPTASSGPFQTLEFCETVECRLEKEESSENIWATANQVLNADQYSALWLRYGEDLPVGEVARVLKKTAVGVRVTLHRARTLLRPHLAEKDADIMPPINQRPSAEGNHK